MVSVFLFSFAKIHVRQSICLFSGYDRKLPGFPRYRVLGNDDSGVFNLQISNASLKDDARYECQVGPSRNERPIRAWAQLNVMRKNSIQIFHLWCSSRPQKLSDIWSNFAKIELLISSGA